MSILKLPNEILVKIMGYLDVYELEPLLLTSKTFYKIYQNNIHMMDRFICDFLEITCEQNGKNINFEFSCNSTHEDYYYKTKTIKKANAKEIDLIMRKLTVDGIKKRLTINIDEESNLFKHLYKYADKLVVKDIFINIMNKRDTERCMYFLTKLKYVNKLYIKNIKLSKNMNRKHLVSNNILAINISERHETIFCNGMFYCLHKTFPKAVIKYYTYDLEVNQLDKVKKFIGIIQKCSNGVVKLHINITSYNEVDPEKFRDQLLEFTNFDWQLGSFVFNMEKNLVFETEYLCVTCNFKKNISIWLAVDWEEEFY
uniref:F-box domain-containing protein n=1 Tax=Parastrongyloides trichosuri TaxID=131310 RepID=A0A0N4ZJP3_PARTI